MVWQVWGAVAGVLIAWFGRSDICDGKTRRRWKRSGSDIFIYVYSSSYALPLLLANCFHLDSLPYPNTLTISLRAHRWVMFASISPRIAFFRDLFKTCWCGFPVRPASTMQLSKQTPKQRELCYDRSALASPTGFGATCQTVTLNRHTDICPGPEETRASETKLHVSSPTGSECQCHRSWQKRNSHRCPHKLETGPKKGTPSQRTQTGDEVPNVTNAGPARSACTNSPGFLKRLEIFKTI